MTQACPVFGERKRSIIHQRYLNASQRHLVTPYVRHGSSRAPIAIIYICPQLNPNNTRLRPPSSTPAEGIWSLLKRAMVNFAAADVDGLARIVKRKLKKLQYRTHLIDGCLARRRR